MDSKQERLRQARILGYECGRKGEAPSRYTKGMGREEKRAFQEGLIEGMTRREK